MKGIGVSGKPASHPARKRGGEGKGHNMKGPSFFLKT